MLEHHASARARTAALRSSSAILQPLRPVVMHVHLDAVAPRLFGPAQRGIGSHQGFAQAPGSHLPA